MEYSEATIVINGVTLTSAQSMTVRVALESFSMECHSVDPHSESILAKYQARISEIRQSLYSKVKP